MKTSKVLRRWLTGLMVPALLFAQIAGAAYVCPMAAADSGQGTVEATMAGMPCAQMMAGAAAAPVDPEQPGLCFKHCQDGSQTFDNSNLAPAAPMLQTALSWRLPELADPAQPAWAQRQRSRERAPPLPHSIAHCCYRL